MFNSQDLGEAHFKTWSEEQRRDEIGKLVEGYRAGLPLGILCRMSEAIAGSQELARDYLAQFMSPTERQLAVAREAGAIRAVAESYLL
jgi:hypothetical protein